MQNGAMVKQENPLILDHREEEVAETLSDKRKFSTSLWKPGDGGFLTQGHEIESWDVLLKDLAADSSDSPRLSKPTSFINLCNQRRGLQISVISNALLLRISCLK